MILFLDIETVAQYEYFEQAPDDYKAIWETFWSDRRKNSELSAEESYRSNAAFYAEFGKVCCIGFAYHAETQKTGNYIDTDESSLLARAADVMDNSRVTHLCGHNSMNFDFPFLARRCLINGLQPPRLLRTFGLKPWEVNLLDTMQIWSGTQWRHNISLDLICSVLGIESPKTQISGSDIHDKFYGGQLEEIGQYCEGDALQTSLVYHKLCALK